MPNILVTGSSGFIGFHFCKKILSVGNKNINLTGIDNHNNFYDINLKKNRLKELKKYKNFQFYNLDITNSFKLNKNFKLKKYDFIIHLAAQAGVRHSIEKPEQYFDSNLLGFFNILESSRKNKIKHLLFASSSSVYGNSNDFPLNEKNETSKPLSFYAATKKCNEVMAYSYSNIYKLRCTAMRFFTVYGPYGRPDMALYKFAESIKNNKKINLFNKGNHERDFTYVDDIVNGLVKLLFKIPNKNTNYFDIYNIASGNPKKLKLYLKLIEKNLGKKARVNFKSMQIGDVKKTHADISKLKKQTKYTPDYDLSIGIRNFITWYNIYSKKN
tara:strand:+ start:638 stop:1621 length:984 start_codon:yes stop_codon:yes gene_type:complete